MEKEQFIINTPLYCSACGYREVTHSFAMGHNGERSNYGPCPSCGSFDGLYSTEPKPTDEDMIARSKRLLDRDYPRTPSSARLKELEKAFKYRYEGANDIENAVSSKMCSDIWNWILSHAREIGGLV